MSNRSPAFARLCEAALFHFSEHGYDGASLSAIAEEVGIRKPSIYSHIGSKDELYLLILDDALVEESEFVQQCFDKTRPIPGVAYIEALAGRFEASPHLQFLLRTAYLPPARHKVKIAQEFESFFSKIRALYMADFEETFGDLYTSEESELFCEAWLGIVDCLCVELLYGLGKRSEVRKHAMMTLMIKAFSSNQAG